MKKLLTFLLSAILCASLSVSCVKKEDSQNVLTVAASPEPHKALLELVTDDLAKENITLKVTEFTDYVTPNDAVETGEQFANFFQHVPYMDTFNKEHGYHLVSVGTVHIEPLALYSKKYGNLSEFKQLPRKTLLKTPTTYSLRKLKQPHSRACLQMLKEPLSTETMLFRQVFPQQKMVCLLKEKTPPMPTLFRLNREMRTIRASKH